MTWKGRMKNKIIPLILALSVSSCSFYQEEFTFMGENGNSHNVRVTHVSALLFGKAAQLNTDTQTEEFIRTVNASDVQQKPDGVDQVTQGLIKAFIRP